MKLMRYAKYTNSGWQQRLANALNPDCVDEKVLSARHISGRGKAWNHRNHGFPCSKLGLALGGYLFSCGLRAKWRDLHVWTALAGPHGEVSSPVSVTVIATGATETRWAKRIVGKGFEVSRIPPG